MLATWLLLALLAVQDQEEPQRGVGVISSEQSSTGYARRHALVVGIDDYQDPAYPDLGCAVADARAVARVPGWAFAPAYGIAWALVLPWATIGYTPFIYFQF